jgi:hypothetical protein
MVRFILRKFFHHAADLVEASLTFSPVLGARGMDTLIRRR